MDAEAGHLHRSFAIRSALRRSVLPRELPRHARNHWDHQIAARLQRRVHMSASGNKSQVVQASVAYTGHVLQLTDPSPRRPVLQVTAAICRIQFDRMRDPTIFPPELASLPHILHQSASQHPALVQQLCRTFGSHVKDVPCTVQTRACPVAVTAT